MTRPVADRDVDRAISRASVAQDRGALARALRLARARGCGPEARAWACWIGWPSVLGSDRRWPCPECGEVAAVLDCEEGDGGGPRCSACWDSAWDFGKLHVPEAWVHALCPSCGATEDVDAVGSSCDGCGGRGIYVEAPTPAPVLVPVHAPESLCLDCRESEAVDAGRCLGCADHAAGWAPGGCSCGGTLRGEHHYTCDEADGAHTGAADLLEDSNG